METYDPAEEIHGDLVGPRPFTERPYDNQASTLCAVFLALYALSRLSDLYARISYARLRTTFYNFDPGKLFWAWAIVAVLLLLTCRRFGGWFVGEGGAPFLRLVLTCFGFMLFISSLAPCLSAWFNIYPPQLFITIFNLSGTLGDGGVTMLLTGVACICLARTSPAIVAWIRQQLPWSR